MSISTRVRVRARVRVRVIEGSPLSYPPIHVGVFLVLIAPPPRLVAVFPVKEDALIHHTEKKT